VYNGSQLTRMTVDTQTTVDGEIVPESHVLDFTYDASGNPQTMTCDGVTYYYSVNIQGDVMAILDESGAIMVHYIRQGYGLGYYIVPSNATGSMLNKLNPFGYRGYVRDRETYLYYLESRYYSEDLCRFINADALVTTGQGLLGNNMFAYCGNNPIVRVDYAETAYTRSQCNANVSIPMIFSEHVPQEINCYNYVLGLVGSCNPGDYSLTIIFSNYKWRKAGRNVCKWCKGTYGGRSCRLCNSRYKESFKA